MMEMTMTVGRRCHGIVVARAGLPGTTMAAQEVKEGLPSAAREETEALRQS